MPQLKKIKPTAKVDLTISLIVHGVIIALLVFFAAREGILGDKLKQFAVVIVPKEKPPKPVEKPPEAPKPVVKQEAAAPKPKSVVVPPPQTAAVPPPNNAPAAAVQAAVAPASAITADFTFNDGAVAVQTSSNPVELFQNSVQNTLKSHWARPDNVDDSRFVVEVEVHVDATGKLSPQRWTQMTGNQAWDDSVRRAFADVGSMNQPPPVGFPSTFTVRFDVQEVSEPLAIN